MIPADNHAGSPRADLPAGKDRWCVRPGVLFKPALLPLLLAAFVLSDCLPQPVPTKPVRGHLAEVLVYLQPVPPEARRVSWKVSDVSAVSFDGTRLPLDLVASDFNGSGLEGRQTLIATGYLPPGSYKGITFTISSASLIREDGKAALMVSEDPLEIAGTFDLAPEGVMPLFVNIAAAGMVTDGVEFSPVFTFALPSRKLTSLTGYLTMPEADRVLVFNTKSMQVTGAVATGRSPRGIAVDSLRSRAYVAVSGADSVEIFDVFTSDVRERVKLRTGDEPVDLALARDGQVLLTANYASDTVSIVDPVQGVEMERIAVGQGPTSIAIDQAGTRAYVTCSQSGTVAVVDLSSETLAATISLDETWPNTAVLDRYEENLFVVSRDSPNLSVVDSDTLQVSGKIYIGTGSLTAAFDDQSGLLFVGGGLSREISIVDPSAMMPVDAVALKGRAGHMIMDHQEKYLLVTIPGMKTLQKVDPVSKRVLADMALDAAPAEVAVLENR